MGFVFKDATTNTPPSHEEIQKEKTSKADIIWDLSSQLGEANHKVKMLEWKLEQIKQLL